MRRDDCRSQRKESTITSENGGTYGHVEQLLLSNVVDRAGKNLGF